MIVLSGADLVLPDRLISPGTIVIDGDRIVDVLAGALPRDGAVFFDLSQRYVVPGFIDVHVHGVGGADVLDEDDGAVARVAERLPRYGVTAFCPTTIACRPDALRAMLAAVRRARTTRPAGGA
ncbi:MAG TPA: amidohydrolase family protein, partial [Vicinamibacterales bacterium]|nr:amidohydrolase family protein [Vicinamibacterales bacterium]